MSRAARYSKNTNSASFAKKMCIYLFYGVAAFVVSLFVTKYIDVLAYRKIIKIILGSVCSVLAVLGICLYILYLKKQKDIFKEIACNFFIAVIILIIPLCFGSDGGKMIQIIIPMSVITFIIYSILKNESVNICILTAVSLIFLKFIDIKTNIFYVNPIVSDIIIYVGIAFMIFSGVICYLCKKNKGKIFKIQLFPEDSEYILIFSGIILNIILFAAALFFRSFIINFGIYFVLVYLVISLLYHVLKKMSI